MKVVGEKVWRRMRGKGFYVCVKLILKLWVINFKIV